MLKKLDIERFKGCVQQLLDDVGQRAVADITARETGKAVYNLHDYAHGKVKPSMPTWERLQYCFPDIFPDPVWVDDQGETYALAPAKVDGNQVHIKSIKNIKSSDIQQAGRDIKMNKKIKK